MIEQQPDQGLSVSPDEPGEASERSPLVSIEAEAVLTMLVKFGAEMRELDGSYLFRAFFVVPPAVVQELLDAGYIAQQNEEQTDGIL